MVTLRTLPISFRALFSSFLIVIGIGYLTALTLMYLVEIKPHQKMGQTLAAGISDEYHGLPQGGSLLAAAMKGPMNKYISDADIVRVQQWIDGGVKIEGYPQIEQIFAKNCVNCHMASAKSIPPLTSFEAVQKVAEADTGTSTADLAQDSHIHLFAISIIFLLTGAIFAMSATPIWLRVCLVVFPYFTILVDIGSWWATKYVHPAFAYGVLVGGTGMALALAAQILDRIVGDVDRPEVAVGSGCVVSEPTLPSRRPIISPVFLKAQEFQNAKFDPTFRDCVRAGGGGAGIGRRVRQRADRS